MEACYFVSWGAQTLAWTHLIPTLISLAIWVGSISKDGMQWAPKIYGFFLFFWHVILLALQTCFAIERPDPYCAHVHTYAFPNMEGFYIASLATFMIAYSYAWYIPLTWVSWLFIYLFVIVPPFILNWFQYSRASEIIISMAIGIVVTVGYVAFSRLYIYPLEPYLLNQAPWTWMHCVDTIGMSKKDLSLQQYVKRVLEKIGKRKK